jgi:hypothetical protein
VDREPVAMSLFSGERTAATVAVQPIEYRL